MICSLYINIKYLWFSVVKCNYFHFSSILKVNAPVLSTNIRCKKTKKGSKKSFFLSYFGVFRRNALWYRRYMMVKKVLMGSCGKKKI